ncbi:vegetative cell wall protein gp1-like [Alnus glutinosa]|uniref:vegetative cell wall protein gp1-like n=1 Tax=Alnus glutinosa TaxID=3517 RepID=UPI002D76AC4A|nr:vegetative cell wall protein gp1-like [Alnus glutinosa]
MTNKAYLSQHVVFDESSFPAKEQAVALLPSQLSSTSNSAPHFIFPTLFTTSAIIPSSPNSDTFISSNIVLLPLSNESPPISDIPQPEPCPTPQSPHTLSLDTISPPSPPLSPSVPLPLREIAPPSNASFSPTNIPKTNSYPTTHPAPDTSLPASSLPPSQLSSS